jgi:hypothetical protein
VVLGLSPARAEEPARAVVDKAIKAVGGADNLAKMNAATWKAKGMFYGFGAEGIPFTGDFAFEHPDKFRAAIDSDFNGQKFQFVTVINGDKGWRRMSDDTNELDKDQLKEQHEVMWFNALVSLAPLVHHKDLKLTSLGESKVEGRPAEGVKVSAKGRRDVSLYFDKETGLLVKAASKVLDERSQEEVDQDTLYSDYKDVGGIKRPAKSRVMRGTNKYIESEVIEYKPADKLDAKLFTAPQG